MQAAGGSVRRVEEEVEGVSDYVSGGCSCCFYLSCGWLELVAVGLMPVCSRGGQQHACMALGGSLLWASTTSHVRITVATLV